MHSERRALPTGALALARACLVMLPLTTAFQIPPPPLVTGATSRIGAGASMQVAPRAQGRRACGVYPSRPCALRALAKSAEREFPAVPVPPSQIDRAIVPGQRRELHLYDPANVAAVRRARYKLRLLVLSTTQSLLVVLSITPLSCTEPGSDSRCVQ